MSELIVHNYIPNNNLTNLVVKDSSFNLSQNDSFNPTIQIVWGNQEEQNTIAFNLKSITESAILFKHSQRREDFLILAIQNFLKRINSSELNDELNHNELSEEEYYAILDKYPNKYEISINNLESPDDGLLIYELVNKIGNDIRDFSISEISEMFSVEESQLITSIKSLSPTLIINGDTQ